MKKNHSGSADFFLISLVSIIYVILFTIMIIMLTGLITTVSLPVYASGNFVGVVGIDISLADLFEEVDYFLQDAQTYAFVVNHDG